MILHALVEQSIEHLATVLFAKAMQKLALITISTIVNAKIIGLRDKVK